MGSIADTARGESTASPADNASASAKCNSCAGDGDPTTEHSGSKGINGSSDSPDALTSVFVAYGRGASNRLTRSGARRVWQLSPAVSRPRMRRAGRP